MKTQDEIVAYLDNNQTWLGFNREVLVPYLDFEHAKKYLKADSKAEEWTGKHPTDEEVLQTAKTYMAEYGWDKALNHRGLSAGRTIEKMMAWGFLLRGEEFVSQLEQIPYPPYGGPMLKWICEQFNWPIPASEDAQNMAAGMPCTPNCDEGCLG